MTGRDAEADSGAEKMQGTFFCMYLFCFAVDLNLKMFILVTTLEPKLKEECIMKKWTLWFCVVTAFVFAFAGMGGMQARADGLTIAVPNDATNEGRALLLLQAYGVITLKEDAGITATVADIIDNPLGVSFTEVEAAMVPNVLPDVDYGIINGNYALAAQLGDALLYENSESPYVNVVSVKGGNEDTPEAKALAAAVLSQKVVDFFSTYTNGAISVVEQPTDGYDPDVDYDALAGKTIKVACTLDPHSYVLNIAKEILAEKNITLDIVIVDDYVTPNTMVDAGDVFANFFAHTPYQDDFNAQNGTTLTTIAGVHVEPMGIYGGKQADLSALNITQK